VKAQLVAQGVKAGRISTVGYGETQPVADNGTAAGKAQNRRVEIAIYANKKMQRAAERGEL
jgi:outer membrane protein OmpA-like peptidoglycan-associated protein